MRAAAEAKSVGRLRKREDLLVIEDDGPVAKQARQRLPSAIATPETVRAAPRETPPSAHRIARDGDRCAVSSPRSTYFCERRPGSLPLLITTALARMPQLRSRGSAASTRFMAIRSLESFSLPLGSRITAWMQGAMPPRSTPHAARCRARVASARGQRGDAPWAWARAQRGSPCAR